MRPDPTQSVGIIHFLVSFFTVAPYSGGFSVGQFSPAPIERTDPFFREWGLAGR